MSGRGRGKTLCNLYIFFIVIYYFIIGKRPGGGPGPGRPPKYPNLSLNREETAIPSETFNESTSGPSGTSSAGGLVDILNQLDANKRNQMLSLVGQYKNRMLSLNDFMLRSRELLGERLYSQLARDMSNAAASRTANPSMPPQMQMRTSAAAAMPSIPSNPSQLPMHSMPQIYGSAHHQYPNANAVYNNNQAPQEVDVSKMDTSSLQDVIQYSGVDLKAEAELLYREHDNNNNNMLGMSSLSVDHRLKFDYFFNPFKFRAIVQHALQRHFFAFTLQSTTNTTNATNTTNDSAQKLSKPLGITEEAVHLLGIAIQKRLIGILRRLAEISRHRVDYGRGRFKIKIENDPKKQIWLQEKLFIEGVGEDKRRSNASNANTTTSTSTGPSQSSPSGVNQVILNPPSLATLNNSQSSTKPVPSTSATSTTAPTSTSKASGTAASSTDESVKTKLANVTAMAALGIRQKSWMSSASSAAPTTGTSTGSAATPSTATSNASTTAQSTDSTSHSLDEKESQPSHPLANFYSLPSSTPLTDADLKAQYYNRTISTVDLITCMESDSHLRRSRLLSVLYESLPRENKNNNTEQ